MTRWNGDMFGGLVFALAVIIVILIILGLTACAQPYTPESTTAATNPYCAIYCVVVQTTIEKNVGDGLTPTVGTAATGGARTRSTVIEGTSGQSALY